jgi:hypothetical protein
VEKHIQDIGKKNNKSMKYLKLYEDFSLLISISKENKEEKDYAKEGSETYWELEDGTKITLKDIVSFLDKENIPVIDIETDKLSHLLIDVERDPNRVEAANLDFPIIVSEYKGEFKSILDGQHRLVKSIKNRIDKIKCRVLDLEKSPEVFRKVFL